jgi:hypothetical protein
MKWGSPDRNQRSTNHHRQARRTGATEALAQGLGRQGGLRLQAGADACAFSNTPTGITADPSVAAAAASFAGFLLKWGRADQRQS